MAVQVNCTSVVQQDTRRFFALIFCHFT